MNTKNFPIHTNITNEPKTYEEWCEILLLGKRPKLPLYATEGNLTVGKLESDLAILGNQEACIVHTSGRSAISQALLSILQNGDHLLIPLESYRSTRFFCENNLPRLGIAVSTYSMCEIDSLHDNVIPGRTKAIIVEAPSNPMTRVPDFEPFFELKEELGVLLLADISLAGLNSIKDENFDLYFHSLSKFGTGVGDIMAGATLGSNLIINQIRRATRNSCDILDPTLASTLLRGLKTFELRFKTQCENALILAKFLEASSLFSNTLYPGLESHPDRRNIEKQFWHTGQIISSEINLEESQLPLFFNSLSKFHLSFGAGFTHSLIAPSKLFYERGLSKPAVSQPTIKSNTLRFSLGIEDVDKLIQDIQNACMNL